MKNFTQLKKNLKNDFSNLKKIRVAILGDTSTQFLVQAIRSLGFDEGFDLNIWEADFNQIERQVFDSVSELYEFKPEIIIIFQSNLIVRYITNIQKFLIKNMYFRIKLTFINLFF